MGTHYIVLKELVGNAPPSLNLLQQFFAPHAHALVLFWTSIWIITAFVMTGIAAREYRHERDH